jgi:two-component system sensor histidine kinase ChiS
MEPRTPAKTPVPPVVSASILAITDDPVVKDLLLELALAEGFGVRCADNEADAANLLRLERPGLLLADLDMPGRVGAKFLRTLKQSPYRDVPCAALTASNDPMLAVTIDAPVFYKPGLEGLDAALERFFGTKPGGGAR